ncbi:MAG: hypothetical protein CME06_18295 [Gemmatimonadetes bacterium]|nr:hypothetical protein [Gemmatimonadota bacterium]
MAPHEPVITQAILIGFDGRQHEAWRFTKHNYSAEGELQRPIKLVCDLDAEPEFQGEVYGICEAD